MSDRITGFISGLGAVEVQTIAVANAETTKTVTFIQPHLRAPMVIATPDYSAHAFVTSITKTGCTLNFTDPTTDKSITIAVIG